MSDVAFTGERLHEGNRLFGVDLVRHRAAYRVAAELCEGARVLDLGCGSGHGIVDLAPAARVVVGVDRVAPDREARSGAIHFVRADLGGIPLASAHFDLAVSFQVIEHLEDPGPYLAEIARLVRPEGTVLISTPNLLTSDRENPYHVHEYLSEELAARLSDHFTRVEMRGVGASPRVARYAEARLRRIRTITRLDPLALRRRLPRALIDWAFARLAVLVRRSIQRSDGLPDVGLEDFPIGPADDACLDLLAVCRGPRL